MTKDKGRHGSLSSKRFVWGVLGIVGFLVTALLSGGFSEIGRMIIRSQIIQQEIKLIQHEIEDLVTKQLHFATNYLRENR